MRPPAASSSPSSSSSSSSSPSTATTTIGVMPGLLCVKVIHYHSGSGRTDLKSLDRLQLSRRCAHGVAADQEPLEHPTPPPRQIQHTSTRHHLSLVHKPTKTAAATISQSSQA
nr:unnamed protein product [Spirometra erinaceieuropaei]